MAGVRIVTDSSCDLTDEEVAAHGVAVVPLSIRFGTEEYEDRSELSVEDFYEKLAASDVLPETAAPSPGAFEAAFRRQQEAGADAVVCINLSSELSATMQSAQNAAREAEMVTAALQGGIVSYLLKPFKITELQARLVGYAERRRLLGGPGDLSQSDLDQALGSAAGSASAPLVPPLPKGLSKETAALAERALRASDPDLAASECAESLGLSRVVARKYLEYFVSIGLATVTLRYGQTGRPQRRYAWVGPAPGPR